MDGGERLEERPDLGALRPKPRRYVLFDKPRQLCLKGFLRHVFFQLQIAIRKGKLPLQRVEQIELVRIVHRHERGQEVEVDVAVRGHVLEDAGDGEVVLAVDGDGLAKGIVTPEILLHHGLTDDDGEGDVERRLGVAAKERHVEDVEDAGVGEDPAFFGEAPVFVAHHPRLPRRLEAHGCGHLRVRLQQGCRPDGRRLRRPRRAFAGLNLDGEAVDLIGARVIPVVAPLVLHVEDDERKTRQPNRQPGPVHERIRLVPLKISERNLQVVF